MVNGVAGDFQQVIRIDSDFFQCFPAFSRIFLMLSTVLPLGFSIASMMVFGLLLLSVVPFRGLSGVKVALARVCQAFSFSFPFSQVVSGDFIGFQPSPSAFQWFSSRLI